MARARLGLIAPQHSGQHLAGVSRVAKEQKIGEDQLGFFGRKISYALISQKKAGCSKQLNVESRFHYTPLLQPGGPPVQRSARLGGKHGMGLYPTSITDLFRRR